MKKYIQQFKEFFATTIRLPGCGFYAGCGKYAGFRPSCDRYGIIINLGYVWFMFIAYDFIASSKNVMEEVLARRDEVMKMRQMYAGRVPRKRGQI